MRRWLGLLLGGVLLGAGSTPALAQNLCSPSTAASTVRYAGYPGSAPYSNITTNITSNCSGPNVNVSITPDPYATDLLPAAAYASPSSSSSGSTGPIADPATLYGPTTPESGYAPAPYAAAPPAMSAGYGVPFSYGGGYGGVNSFGPPAALNPFGAFGTPGAAQGGLPGNGGYPGYPAYGAPYGPVAGYPAAGYGPPRFAPPYGYGSLVPGGYPGAVPGGY